MIGRPLFFFYFLGKTAFWVLKFSPLLDIGNKFLYFSRDNRDHGTSDEPETLV